jgi:gliding motility-associated-like protein
MKFIPFMQQRMLLDSFAIIHRILSLSKILLSSTYTVMFRRPFVLLLAVLFLSLSYQTSHAQCANFGTGSSQDYDCDGVINSVDLDDDNDGVPDTQEGCVADNLDLTKVTWTTADANMTVTAPTSNSLAANVTVASAWRTKFSNETFKLPIDMTFSYSTATSLRMFGFAPTGGAVVNNNWTSTAFGFFLDGDQTQLRYNQTFNNPVTSTVSLEHRITISSNGVLNLFINGILVYTQTGLPLTTYRLYLAAVSGAKNIENITYSPTDSTQTCTLDTDGDGNPNSLDLDSDGDGCSDAFEAGATTSVTSNFKFSFVSPTNDVNRNGLIDSKEQGESGVINYPSTYTAKALSSAWSFCQDADGDDVADINDIDNDNDGVPDVQEGCAPKNLDFSKVTWTTADATMTITATSNSLTNNAFGAGWRNKFSNQTFRLPLDMSFTYSSTAGLKMFGFAPVPFLPSDVAANNWTSTAFGFFLNGSQTQARFDKTFSTPVNTTDGLVHRITISTNGVMNLFINGELVFTRTGLPISDYRIYFASDQVAKPIQNIAFSPTDSIPTCTLDTDGDGTPNSLDLDSDGDGCSDAFEAGSTTSLTANSKFTFTSPTNDINKNGLIDTKEQGESGVINYRSTYAENALSPSAKPCQDTDGDGIADVNDIDDDNDGVPDEDECFAANGYNVYVFNRTNDQNVSGIVNFSVAGGVTKNYTVNQRVAGTDLSYDGFNWKLLASNVQPDATGKITVTLTANSSTPGQYAFADAVLVTNGFSFYQVIDGGIAGTPGWTTTGANWVGQPAAASYKGNQFFVNTPVATTHTSVWTFSSLAMQSACDLDNDGVINSLDSDSDGDGCSDALESGATTDKTTNFKFTSSVGTNGLADSLETVTDNGVIKYNSTYTNYALNSSFLACTDTDNDGIIDLNDIDDDNDGIPDAIENSCDTYFYTGADQTVIVPPGATFMTAKLWGAGGGGGVNGNPNYPGSNNGSTGGGGGFISGKVAVTPGTTLQVIVGQAGLYRSFPVPSESNPNSRFPTYGGGGGGGTAPDGIFGASGGGRSEIRVVNGASFTSLFIAGGGGGATSSTLATAGYSFGGGGGGLVGMNAIGHPVTPNGGGKGGTQSAGGAGGGNGAAGTQYQGGNGGSTGATNSGGGGGGGGGWYGGGGGNGQPCEVNCGSDNAGGGGSSYAISTASNVFIFSGSTETINTIRNGGVPAANTSDPSYITGIGIGGNNRAKAGNGLVVICWTIDTDGDGIPNDKDLDSDGDGCNDAVEGGSAPAGTSAPLTGNVGTNGLLNSLETVPDNGVINFTSTYANATNASVNNCTVPIITPPASSAVCAPNTIALSVDLKGTTAPSSYQWFNGTNSITGANSSTYNASASGTYTCKLTYANSTTYTTEGVTVTVNAQPSSPVISGYSSPVCQGTTVNLSSSYATGNQWYFNGSILSGETNQSYNNAVAGTYKVVYTDANNCASESSITVVINPKPLTPIVDVTQPNCSNAKGAINITPTGNPGDTYSIDGVNYSSTTTYSNLNPGSYSVTVRNSSGCVSAPFNAVINTQPAVPVAPTVSVVQPTCTVATGSLTISAPTGTEFTYSIDGANYGSSTTFNNLSAGTYNVTVKNTSGCISTPTVAVIDPQPAKPTAPVITVSESSPVCAGTSVTLTSSLATSYQWYNEGVAIVGANSQTYTTNLSGTFTVVVTNAAGCSSLPSAPEVVTVNPIPTASIAQGSSLAFTDCSQTSLTLTATTDAATPTYQWYKGGVAISGATSSTYTVTEAGSYKVMITANGCSNTSPATTISGIPTASASGSTAVCQGGTVTLSTGTSGTSYQWQRNAGSGFEDINGATASSYDATATGSYLVVVDGSSSCPIDVTVNTLPSATLSALPSTSVCAGTQVTINADATGAATISYQWLQSGIPIGTATGSSYTTSTSGTFEVKVTDGNGCQATSAQIVITVNELPAAPAVSVTQPTCTVSTGTITISAPTGTGITYSIDGINYQSGTVFSNLPAGAYSVTAKSAEGCISSATLVTINTQPTPPAAPASITGETILKPGTTQVYTAAVVPGATSYTWTLPNGWTGSSVTNTILVTMNSVAGTISVTANVNGCISPAATLIVTNPKIALIKTASSATGNTVGDQITYTFTVTNTGDVTLTSPTVSDAKLGISNLALTPTTLAPGATTTGTATYTITQADMDAGSISNTAVVTAKDPLNRDVTDSSDNDSNNENDPTLTPLTQNPKIGLVKTASSAAGKTAGDQITYTFTATNTGNVTLTSPTVSDAKLGISNLALTPTTLAPGATATGTATYTITQVDITAGGITNTAVVTAKDPLNRNVTDSSDNNSNNENDPTVTPLTQNPKIGLVKTVSSATGNTVGDQITYTFTATNTGDVTLTSPTVSDAKLGISNLALTPTTLAPGATATGTATYTITQADMDAGSISNTAVVTAKDPLNRNVTDSSDNDSNNENDPTVTPLTQDPKIGLVKTASSATGKIVGDQITYTFTATNTGNVTLTNPTITDAKLGISNLALTPTTLAPGATATGTATYTITQADMDAGSITNIAVVTAKDPLNRDVTDSSDNDSNNENDPTVTPLTQNPKIALIKTASSATGKKAGDQITYTFTATNTGNVTLTSPTVSDAKLGISNLALTPTTLAPGATATGTATYTITQADMDAGSISNTAVVTAKDPLNRDVTDSSDNNSNSENDPTVTPLTQDPKIALVKTASSAIGKVVGDQITYTFTTTNTGNVTLTNPTITDAKLGISNLALTPTTLAPGATATGTATYTITQADMDAGSISNTAVVTAKDPLNRNVTDSSDNNSNNENDPTVTPLTQNPKIALIKTASSATGKKAGDQITYTFTATNTGNVTLTSPTVSDAKLGISNLALIPTTLAPGATATGTATYTITQADMDAGSITNTAVVTAKDPLNRNVTDSSDNNSNSENDPTVTPLTQNPKIALIKTASSATGKKAGDQLTYTFTATNTGNVTLTSPTVSDAKLGISNLALIPTTLAPGATATGTATYTITQADMDAGSITNTAVVTAKDPLNRNVTDSSDNNSNSENEPTVTPLTQDPKIALVKTASSADGKKAGDQITYTFTATNTGNVTLTNPTITDAKIGVSNLALTPTTLAPGATATGIATYTITQADMLAGTIVNTATVNGLAPNGSPVSDISDSSSVNGSRPTIVNLPKYPPVAVDDKATTPEDTPVSGNVLSNDTDANDDPLTVLTFTVFGVTYPSGSTATIPGVGTLVINPDGSYTFTPVANFNGPVPQAVYTVSDGKGGTDTANLDIVVTPVNDPPVAVDDKATTPEDTPVSGNVLSNDSDADGDPLTVTQFTINGVTYPAGSTATIPGVGTLVINPDGSYTFTPAPNYNGPVPIATYTVSDGKGGTDTADLNIIVTPVNDPPVAVDDKATTPEDTPVSGNVLTNDTDTEGNTLTVTQFIINGVVYPAGSTATIPGVGTLVINANGSYTFTPAPDFNGPVPQAVYTVSDGQGGTDTANLDIVVIPVADPSDILVTDVSLCGSGSTTLSASSTTIASPEFKWYTDAALTNLVFTGAAYTTPVLSATTRYYITVSGSGVLPNVPGNAKVATVTINPPAPTPVITAGGPTSICQGGSVVLNAGSAASYQWYLNGGIIAGATGNTYTASASGVYTVVSTNTSGCTSAPSTGITVTVNAIPPAATVTAGGPTIFCQGGNVTLTSSAASNYQWFFNGTAISGATGQSYVAGSTGNYTVVVTSAAGCSAGPSAPTSVTVNPVPASPLIKADGPTTFCKEDFVVLRTTKLPGITYQWFVNGAQIPNATADTLWINTEGNYAVRLTNSFGCQSASSAIIQIKVPCTTGVYMPSVFTPNGDGINDVVTPIVPGMAKFECFKIYNRWGNLVFEGLTPSQGWDGKYRGALQPNDTYIWIVLGQDRQGKPIKATGQITLVR